MLLAACARLRNAGSVAHFPGIEFAGVRQRSPQFSCPLNSHGHPCVSGQRDSACPGRLPSGCEGCADREAQASVRVVSGWRPAGEASGLVLAGPGGEPRGLRARAGRRAPETPGQPGEAGCSGGELRTGVSGARRQSGWRPFRDGASGCAWSVESAAERSGRSAQARAAGPSPGAVKGQDPDS